MKNKKILIIDDNENNRYLATFILEKEGFAVLNAESGFMGIEIAKKQKIDLIIMDIKMPKMDGNETTRRIRKLKDYKDTPIIALTSYAMKKDKENALNAGCTDYMAKPINPETFANDIKFFLEMK